MRILKIFFVTAVFFLNICGAVFADPAQNVSTKEIEKFVRVKDVDPNIVVDLRYATTNNFTKKKVYSSAVCLLRKETALKLAAANREFMQDGYRIKVFDAYRPLKVQEIFWEIMPDDRYVANPHKGGSKHNRGGAVDITLVDQKGNELQMPSAFDDFTSRAARDNLDMTPETRKNVEYLTFVMRSNGFIPLKDEWWHFDDNNWQNFSLVDVNFEDFLDNQKNPAQIKRLEDKSGIPSVLKTLDKSIQQALIVESADKADFKAKLTMWELKNHKWQMPLTPMEAVIGKNGFARLNQKKEGDGKTPSGIFSLGACFGYGPSLKTKLILYRQVDDDDFWIDDPTSDQYNQWVHGPKPNAKSFERLKRDDNLYKYAIIIEYNTAPIEKGKGSAIFIHVWRNSNAPTAGCVALAQEDILKLIGYLSHDDNPVIILGKVK